MITNAYSEPCLKQPSVCQFKLTYTKRWLLYKLIFTALVLFVAKEAGSFIKVVLPNTVTILDRFH